MEASSPEMSESITATGCMKSVAEQTVKLAKFKKPWTPVGRKSCLVTKHMRQHKLYSQLSPLVQRMLNTYSENGTQDDRKEGSSMNSTNKITWCASTSSSKKCNPPEEYYSNTDTNVLPNVCGHARGKWVFKLGDTSCNSLDQVWIKLCRLSKKGYLPQCNSKVKESDSAIWVYCNVSRARKVLQVLRKEAYLHQANYYVQGECLLQADGIGIKDMPATTSDR